MPVVSKADFTKCMEGNAKCGLGDVGGIHAFQVLELNRGRDALSILHNFFLRPERARVLKGGNPLINDDLRNRLEAWVLGLPREQRGGTGYIMRGNVTRRASPMLLAVHSKQSYLAVFISADWPRELTWRAPAARG
ncbi:hypothetical protein [Vulcanisaeta distributa]|uniref:hypothetical protein n=1 Tax=Vulcanisaeta distributa TaxID=164451 RepID=UPI0006CF4C9B|nr:hypothetical protein [Vulcanisaeta distributa]